MSSLAGELFASVAEAKLPVDRFDLGRGISLSETYAHLFGGFFMYFERPTAEKPLPDKLTTTQAGFGYDIEVQLHIPLDFEPNQEERRLEILQWFSALLRLVYAPGIHIPIISKVPFSLALGESDSHLVPLELGRRSLLHHKDCPIVLDTDTLRWLARVWESGFKLYSTNSRFRLAVKAFDGGASSGDAGLYMLSLWSGLEALFSQSHTELAFRLSVAIAVFVEPPGKARHELQKKIVKLYGIRSKIAHGNTGISSIEQPLLETYSLMKAILVKIVHTGQVPEPEKTMRLLLGDI